MQTEIQGTVTDVQGRQVKTGTIFDVTFSGGEKVSTFKAPIAEKANSLKGQNAKAAVEVNQNGDFTNYTLLDIAAAAPGVGAVVAAQRPHSSLPLAPAISPEPINSPGRQESIVRQCCIKAAGHAFAAGSNADEVLVIAEKFYQWCQNEQSLDDAIQQNGLEQAVEPATVVQW